MATINETKVIITDSEINCRMRRFLSEPRTFLIPTSLDRREDLAVVRLTKLMQANKSITNAIAVNM